CTRDGVVWSDYLYPFDYW
nr:immunoglobulin heavy chain junction region [Macaca mulatta]MOV35669.1 immunoglobulin heavy chain junction region [Macaca mulatta]